MKKVLIVAYYFPPIATIGSMRPLAFCRHLPGSGWSVRVLAADPRSPSPPLPIDAELATRIPAGTTVDRVGQRDPVRMMIRVRDRLRQWIAPRSDEHRADAPRGSSASPPWSLKELALTHLFQVPDVQRGWHGPAVRLGRRGERPDLVYATGGPWTSLLVGQSLARHFGVPFVADFRDPWTRNPFRSYHDTVWRRSRRLEREVCRSATRIVVNTVNLRRQFAADYPSISDRFVTISNGFDVSEDGHSGPRPELPAREQASSALELWHFGTVYGRRTPAALLTAVERLMASGTIDGSRLRLRFVGPWELDDDDPASRLAKRLETLGVVRREPPVAHRTCLALMRSAEMLLVLQPDSPLQVPGKLFECIASQRPLVVIGGQGATADLVTRHALGRCCTNDVMSIKPLLSDLLNGARPNPLPVDVVDAFNYRRLTVQLADVFDASLNARPDTAAAA